MYGLICNFGDIVASMAYGIPREFIVADVMMS